MTMHNYAEIFPPGEFLKDELEARNWSQTEFAEIIGRPVRLINEIIAGKRSITPETAIQFSASLGTSAELWMNLESQFQLSKVTSTDSLIERKAKLYANFPVRELIRRGWVSGSDDIEILEQQFLRFYCISTLDEEPHLAHAAKKTTYGEATSILQESWLFRVKHLAKSFVLPEFNRDSLIKNLPNIQALQTAPEECRHVTKYLNEAGVRFVVVEALAGSKIDGACLWLSENQPVIAMSSRLDRIDNFWFVLRHEIEHVLLGHGKEGAMLDIDIGELNESEPEEEILANAAASQFGVNNAELQGYMARVNPYFFARDRVLGFAARLKIHPGIVIGRLQKTLDKQNYPDAYKYLRDYLVKVRQFVMQSAPTDGWGNVFPVK
jgi:HTH-type transcriptional regulator / antitoxin HigA